MPILVRQRWLARFSDHGDHPITRDHPIVDATKITAEQSQIVQSGHLLAGLTYGWSNNSLKQPL
jgi:hypothetical protein